MAETKKQVNLLHEQNLIDSYSERIRPSELVGYDRLSRTYDPILKMHQNGVDFERDAKAAAILSNLNNQILDIIRSNPNILVDKEIAGKDMNNLLYSQVRQIDDKRYGDRVAAEFFFASVLPDMHVKEFLKKHNVREDTYPESYNPESLRKQTPTMRAYLLKLLPGTPWVLVDITDKETWYVRGGIDTFLTMINDDCPLCVKPFILENPFANSMISGEERKEYKLRTSDFMPKGNYCGIADRRLEVVPYGMLEKAILDYRSLSK